MFKQKKDRQFGFKTTLENGKKLVFLGDETFDEKLRNEVENADWLLHEAMCMDSEADIFKPYEKMHSTVKTASEIGASLNVKNLVLYHASDNNLENRKRLEQSRQLRRQKKHRSVFIAGVLSLFTVAMHKTPISSLLLVALLAETVSILGVILEALQEEARKM